VSTTERNIHLGVLGAALAVAVWVFGAQPRAGGPATRSGTHFAETEPRSPLALLPPGSAFILSVDVRALASAPLGAFIAERLGRSAGTSKLAESCGFDPLLRLDQLALSIPTANLAADAHPDFGVIANGRFTAAEITRCASTAINARGGEAVRSKLDSFDTVRDRNGSSGEIAAKDGLVVVSGGNYFRELLNTAEGGLGNLTQHSARGLQHADLRHALGPGPVLATWLLGEGWFERVAGTDANARLSPLSALQRLGARVNVTQTAQLLVLLECADSAGAERIATLLRELQSSLDVLPLDPALRALAKRITLNQKEARLTLELELNRAELSPVLAALDSPSAPGSP
jgi:hypothetical protein